MTGARTPGSGSRDSGAVSKSRAGELRGPSLVALPLQCAASGVTFRRGKKPDALPSPPGGWRSVASPCLGQLLGALLTSDRPGQRATVTEAARRGGARARVLSLL